MRSGVERAKFVRQLYNFLGVLEREGEVGDTEEKIRLLQSKIEQYERKNPMKSFYTEDSPGTGSNNQGAGGGAGGTRDCAELREHGYEVNPRAGDISDGMGGVMKPFSSQVRQPLFTCAPC
jgi:hypothetical protein